MTTVEKIRVKREENSKWENALELIIHDFDAIQIILDSRGNEISEYYDCGYIEPKQTITL